MKLNCSLPTFFLVAAAIIVLTGCESKLQKTNNTKIVNDPNVQQMKRESEKLEQCRRELGALQTINSELYKKQKSEFDHLMGSAVQYAGVRARINDDTQTTVDALYRYRVSRLCAQIDQSVLNNLVENVEPVK